MDSSFEETGGGDASEGRLSKSRRVRKKSAKVLEMEEAEKLEKKLFKKESPRQGQVAKKKPTKNLSGDIDIPMAAVPTIINTGMISPKKTEVGIAKLSAVLSNMPAKLPEQEIKQEIKVEMIDLDEDDEDVVEEDTKMGIVLSPILPEEHQETPAFVKNPPKSSKKKKISEGEESATKEPKKKKKKVKKELIEGVSPSEESAELLIALSEAAVQQTPVVEKSPKKDSKKGILKQEKRVKVKKTPLKMVIKAEEDLEDGRIVDSQGMPLYSDTAQMALKLKTSAERKATKEKKPKKVTKENDEAKKKKVPTATLR